MPIIVTPGKLPSEKWYQEECKNCNCVFAFKKDETTRHDGDYRYPPEAPYYTINCPTCSESVYTDFSQLYVDPK